MAIILKYDAKGVSPKFWHELYGYSKGKYNYPGLLKRLGDVHKLSDSVLLVPESEVKTIKRFLNRWKVKYEVFKVTEGGRPKEAPPAKEEPLRWDMPIEVLDERLKDFGERIDKLGGIIRHPHVRDAVEDTKRFGY